MSGDAPPAVARTVAELRRALENSPGPRRFVPTMGALHAGHAALIDAAAAAGGTVVVSVFVNPTQFGPGEDLDAYPRTFDADLALCGEHGAGVVFAPTAGEIYPAGSATTVRVAGPLTEVLEAAHRPGHFDGVTTVVAKLLNLVRPDAAVFGEKDFQQLAVVRRMAADLNLPCAIESAPTVREPDGLALSSRNRYLSPRTGPPPRHCPPRCPPPATPSPRGRRSPTSNAPPPTGWPRRGSRSITSPSATPTRSGTRPAPSCGCWRRRRSAGPG